MYCYSKSISFLFLLLASSSTSTFAALPTLDTTSSLQHKSNEERFLAARSFDSETLRVLCLGASITYGYLSSDGNGFRGSLRKYLVEDGHTVNMIGSVNAGSMRDNQVEGWSGYRIAEVAAKAELSLPSLPNVVCIFVGTNDMTQGYETSTAYGRMATLVDRIFAVVPGVTIILATLLPNGKAAAENDILQFNSQLISVVNTRASAGKRITLVDMHNSEFSLADIGPDGTHPLEEGYRKMAIVFYNGIKSMGSVIQAPASVDRVDDAAAPNDPGEIISVDVTCQVVVTRGSECVTSSTTSTCDPATSGCPYGSQTTILQSQILSWTANAVMAVQGTSATSKESISVSSSLSTSAFPTPSEILASTSTSLATTASSKTLIQSETSGTASSLVETTKSSKSFTQSTHEMVLILA